jgi:hypothetical protein
MTKTRNTAGSVTTKAESYPNSGKDCQVPKPSKTKGNGDGQLKKLEWQIGQARFQIDRRSASYTTPTKNPLATHSKEIGTLMTAYGLIKDSPGIATVGITTASQPNRNEKGWVVRWKDVHEIKFDPEQQVIMLKEKWFTGGLGGGLGTFCIQCTPENYASIASACQAFQNPTPQTTRRPKVISPQPETATSTTMPNPPPPTPTLICPSCGEPLAYIPQYNRYYCYKEQKYV